jgi:hypothetical protein
MWRDDKSKVYIKIRAGKPDAKITEKMSSKPVQQT